MKNVLCNRTVDVPANVSIALRGHTVIEKGPTGSCGGRQSHQYRHCVSLEGERRGSGLTNVGEEKGTGSCSHYLWSRTERDQGRCPGISTYAASPAMSLSGRMVLLLKYKISCVKTTSAGFGGGQALLAQCPKLGRMSSFLKEATLNMYQIQLLRFSKPQRLETKIQTKSLDGTRVSEKGTVQRRDE